MPLRYLVGPVAPSRAHDWDEHHQQGRCLTFNAEGTADLLLGHTDDWGAVLARLPPDWRPDYIVLDLGYSTVPAWLWHAPVPLVALAPDWPLLWHFFRRFLPLCQLVLTDRAGVAVLRRQGIAHAVSANLFGLQGIFAAPVPAQTHASRDIDILFVGNLHPAVQRERLRWLGRIARQGGRFRVHITQAVHGEEYRQLLLRSRIVFNRSIRGEWNLRVGEACTCGALLFAEADHLEMPAVWKDGEECVFYNEANLETLLVHYLMHEDERQRIAEQGRRKVQAFTFAALWNAAAAQIDEQFADISRRHETRPTLQYRESLFVRTWQALGAADAGDPLLIADLDAELSRTPDASLHNARGLVEALMGKNEPGSHSVERLRRLAGHFQQSARLSPGGAVAAMNLIEVLVVLKEKQLAVQGARRLLSQLLDGRLSLQELEQPHYPPKYTQMRVEWERAAWEHAGRPEEEAKAKRSLLRWRLHGLLGDLTGELHHFHEAALARPDLPPTRAALGCALGRTKRPVEAIGHLQFAVQADPFDRTAARALFQALIDAGKQEQADAFKQERCLLHRSAPTAVVRENWFLPASKDDDPSAGAKTSVSALDVLMEQGCLVGPSQGLVEREVGDRPKTSLCLIVKNEEDNLGACLTSAVGLFGEIVVVDTGSTDRTREIALEHERASSISPGWTTLRRRATRVCGTRGEWIFWLDADDRLDADNREKLRRLLDHLPEGNVAFSIKCRCLSDPLSHSATVVDHIRLFRNDPRIRWRYRIHEQILPAVRAAGGCVEFADVVVQHTGYTDPALRQRKLQRDLRLLEIEHREQPHDPFTLFNLGASYAELRRYEEALPLLHDSLSRSHPSDSIVRKLYALIANCHLSSGRAKEALQACARGLAVCPDDQELLFLEALIRTEQGDLHGAKALLLRLLGGENGQHFASVVDGLRGHKGRHQLALVCFRLGEASEAESLWRGVLRDRPDFLPSRIGLGELQLAQKRWQELEEGMVALQKLPHGNLEAVLLRSKAHLAREEFAQAQTLLEEALVRWPGCLPVLGLLSHALLQEGRRPDAAEKVLGEILDREPGNAQALRNLEGLRRRRRATA